MIQKKNLWGGGGSGGGGGKEAFKTTKLQTVIYTDEATSQELHDS